MSSLVDDAVSGLRTAASGRVSTASLITVVALCLIGAQLAFRAWAVYAGWFYGDDLTFLADVARGDADLDWIFQRYGVHFMPVGLTLALIVGHSGDFAWSAAATEMIAFQALASLACWWMLRTLFGNRPLILVPLALYLFTAASMPALMWWAAGLNMITVQPAIFAAVTLHILYLRSGKKVYAFLAALAFGFGLLCYVKALLIPMVLGILAVSYFAQGSPWHRFIDVVRRFWFGWILYGVIGVVYLWLYLTHGEAQPPGTEKVDYPGLVNDMVFANLGTGLLGGPWNWLWLGPGMGPRLMSDPPQLAITLSTVVVVAVTLLLALRFRGGYKPLLFLIPYVALSIAIIGQGRAAAFGDGVSMEIRYWTDFIPYLALGIGLMTMPLRGATDPLEPRVPAVINIPMPRIAGPGVAGLVVAGAMYSSVTYVEPWHEDFQTRQFIERAVSDLKRENGIVEIADEGVPDGVVNTFSYPYNLPSRFLAPISEEFSTPATATDLQTLDAFGRLTSGQVGEGIAVPTSGFGDCIVGSTDGEPTAIDLGAKTLDFPFWLSMTYRSTSAGSVTLIAGNNWRHSPVSQGKHTLFVRTEGTYDTMSVAVSPGTTLCIDAIQIGPRIEARP